MNYMLSSRRKKAYGPGDIRTHDPFAGISFTTDLPAHIGQVGSVAA